jgi:hypothetical protein
VPDSATKGEPAQGGTDLIGCGREGGLDGLAPLAEVVPAFVVDGKDGAWPQQPAEATASRAVIV